MTNIAFWQTVAAVIVGNSLLGVTVYLIWRVSKEEKGIGRRVPLWLFPAAMIAPALVILAGFTLP
ncbi:hypothetical protein SAMN04489859_1008128 [Paracoccus alcaliphilus]|uniref:Uncharacterized protein n=1 Tax=Paracoccus alcaliphilus TaxID=34002 RepID=A0A1H8H4T5_9RHOB|nr:hypothetical protein [Paracoccus alcaliphilus]WCR17365.1 hypothetical protein JHW40_13590 [Paracoccus alcaliphilus]SEN51411.1 hypothetical protein SAMN04489859_1008128 [Paracoccus alcaliphilus]